MTALAAALLARAPERRLRLRRLTLSRPGELLPHLRRENCAAPPPEELRRTSTAGGSALCAAGAKRGLEAVAERIAGDAGGDALGLCLRAAPLLPRVATGTESEHTCGDAAGRARGDRAGGAAGDEAAGVPSGAGASTAIAPAAPPNFTATLG